jgi:hypothetical protein
MSRIGMRDQIIRQRKQDNRRMRGSDSGVTPGWRFKTYREAAFSNPIQYQTYVIDGDGHAVMYAAQGFGSGAWGTTFGFQELR